MSEYFRPTTILLMLFALTAAIAFRPGGAVGQVVINEFMAVNQSTTTTLTGEFADWIELYNPSIAPVALGGYYLSDDPTSPVKWRIPNGTTINPGRHLLIWADDTQVVNPADPLHASFRLSGEDGEYVALYAPDGATTISFIQFGPQATDVSYGRVPDNSPLWFPFVTSTPGGPNLSGAWIEPPASGAGLIINEWMASNGDTIRDNTGDNDDWVEIYNSTNLPIDMGGYYLTDATTEPTKFLIPKGCVVGAGEFILFWIDDDEEEGLNHASFNLNRDGEALGLYEKDGVTPIDTLTFGPQFRDISEGRRPDGAARRVFFSHPTPRESNFQPSARAHRWELYR